MASLAICITYAIVFDEAFNALSRIGVADLPGHFADTIIIRCTPIVVGLIRRVVHLFIGRVTRVGNDGVLKRLRFGVLGHSFIDANV